MNNQTFNYYVQIYRYIMLYLSQTRKLANLAWHGLTLSVSIVCPSETLALVKNKEKSAISVTPAASLRSGCLSAAGQHFRSQFFRIKAFCAGKRVVLQQHLDILCVLVFCGNCQYKFNPTFQ